MEHSKFTAPELYEREESCYRLLSSLSIPFERCEELIGHAAGGVCPFGINEGIRVFLDETLKNYEFVYPAAGNDKSGVRLTPDELFSAVDNAEWIDVCKMPEI